MLGNFIPSLTTLTGAHQQYLDYIFILEPAERPATVNGVAKPIPTTHLEPGLPQKGICGSDHISLSAEISWRKRSNTSS